VCGPRKAWTALNFALGSVYHTLWLISQMVLQAIEGESPEIGVLTDGHGSMDRAGFAVHQGCAAGKMG
jgi:hypothetical protein